MEYCKEKPPQGVAVIAKVIVKIVIVEIFRIFKEHKVLLAHLIKLITKSILRVPLSTLIVKQIEYGGMHKEAQVDIIVSILFLLPDLIQFILEAACAGVQPFVFVLKSLSGSKVGQYNKFGPQVGMIGNIVIGAMVGIMVPGSTWYVVHSGVNITFGALAGFIIWTFGEAVNRSVSLVLAVNIIMTMSLYLGLLPHAYGFMQLSYIIEN